MFTLQPLFDMFGPRWKCERQISCSHGDGDGYVVVATWTQYYF